MTDQQFKEFYKKLDYEDKFKLLGHSVMSVTIKKFDNSGTDSYSINNIEDFDAVIEQELYENLTGRE